MKIVRSTKCSLKFATEEKRALLRDVLSEYGKVVNFFIERFWVELPEKADLLKEVVNLPTTWVSARLRKVAAREAIDMVLAAKERWKEKAVIPVHKGQHMAVSSTIARLEDAEEAKEFDSWLVLWCIGKNIKLSLPIRLHKHFRSLLALGKRTESYIITEKYVQFAFKIFTAKKLAPTECIGIDTGINALASLSTGEQFGLDTKEMIARINCCRHGSKGQKRASRALRQRMDEVAKEVVQLGTLVVVEDLRNITKGTKKKKRRVSKGMRRTLGRWNYSYWLTRLRQQTERNRVSYRTVQPRWTSQKCPFCNHIERGNRVGELFRCLKCGHTDNADVNAARNILSRFLTGPYGAGCKPKSTVLKDP